MSAVFRKDCDVYQGYNFRKDVQTSVGFITGLKIGDTELTADQKVEDPETSGSQLEVIAILSLAEWGLANTDPLYFTGQVTAGNKQSLQTLTFKDLTKIDVELKFAIYSYDPLQKQYFQCLAPSDSATLKGLLEKHGADLVLEIDDTSSGPVASPENYRCHIGIKPKSTAQSITVTTGVGKNIARQWGIEEKTS